MIISHKHKFIFLKSRKTAGSSIQAALSTACDPSSDIITGDNIVNGVLDESTTSGWNMNKFYTTHPHPELLNVKNHVGKEVWDEYFKFCFVRNPYEIVVSRYHWDIKGKQQQETSIEGFKEWVNKYCAPGGTYTRDLQCKYFMDGNVADVEFIGRYENLNEDYEEVCGLIGIEPPELGFQKSGYRDKKVHYSTYFNETAINKVTSAFTPDLSVLRYKFENKTGIEVDRKGMVMTMDELPFESDNICFPSVIKVPEFVKHPLGKYYMYFGHHQGKQIKLAYSDDLYNWKVCKEGVLHLDDTPCFDHISSPDIQIRECGIMMYYHGKTDHGQKTFKAVSCDGITFEPIKAEVGKFYFREFEYHGKNYGIAKNGNEDSVIYEDVSVGQFVERFNILDKSRHCGVHVKDDILNVFYTTVGDCPEYIKLLRIKLDDDINNWEVLTDDDVMKPEEHYEGSYIPRVPSSFGRSFTEVCELRDPYPFVDDEKMYLFYCVKGEHGIALAELGNI